jgi:hypothetical protein
VTTVSAAATQLLERIDRELDRAQGSAASTERVGGWAKLGTCFDVLLRAAVRDAANHVGVTPQELIARTSPNVNADKATAGQIAYVLKAAFTPPTIAPLVADLRASNSAIRAVIHARNEAVHEPGREPSPARTRQLLPPLRRVIEALDRTSQPVRTFR